MFKLVWLKHYIKCFIGGGIMKYLLILAVLVMALYSAIDTGYELKKESYVVRSGDTIWTIAERYYEKQDKYRTLDGFIYDISKENNGCNISPGDVLVIPLEIKKDLRR